MQIKQLIDYLVTFPGAQESYPFGPDTQVFKVMGKMFALLGQRNGQSFVNLKAKPEDVLFLSEQYEAITLGYHMNKLHWVSIEINNPEMDVMLEDLVNHSYQLIVSKLPKKQQLALKNAQ